MFISSYEAPYPGLAIPPISTARPPDIVRIRGTSLSLHELVDSTYFKAERILALREKMHGAKPFPHLVLKDLFNPVLLELVQENSNNAIGTTARANTSRPVEWHWARAWARPRSCTSTP